MSKGPVLRSLVAERLAAAAEEIFTLIERTVLEYEEELCRSKEENERKQQLLDTVLSPQVNRAGVQFRMLSRSEESVSICPEAAQTPPQLTTLQEFPVEDISDAEPEDSVGGVPQSQGKVTQETQEQPGGGLGEQPEEKPGERPEEQPGEGLGEQPEEQPGEQPGEGLGEQPEEQPEEEPEEKPGELEPPCSSSAQEMGTEAGEDDDGDEINEEATDVEASTEESAKPKGRKSRKRRVGAKASYKNKCTVCGKVLKGPPNNLLRHMVIHTGLRPYSCSVCKRKFTQRCYYKKHMEGHEKEKEQQRLAAVQELETFGCPVCLMRFKRQVALKKHMESHGVAKDTQSGQRKEVGVQHEAPKIKVQEEEVENRTGENGEDYTQATLMKNAMNSSSHAAPGDFKCHICPRTFTTRTRLKRHMIVHTGAKPFSCPVCHKLFSQKYNVRLHMAVHTDEKPYTCQICLKSYRRNDDLRTHMAGHTGQILFSCMVCNATFKQRNCLTTHMRLHTGDRPYRCSVCDKTFIQKSNLNRHERSHTGEKPFRCPVCPQRFLQRCDIRKHMAVHT